MTDELSIYFGQAAAESLRTLYPKMDAALQRLIDLGEDPDMIVESIKAKFPPGHVSISLMAQAACHYARQREE